MRFGNSLLSLMEDPPDDLASPKLGASKCAAPKPLRVKLWGRLPTVQVWRARPATTQARNQGACRQVVPRLLRGYSQIKKGQILTVVLEASFRLIV
jgi:hypothetical protein